MQSMVKVIDDYHIPIITITSTRDNPVAQASNIVLTYGKTDENEMHMVNLDDLPFVHSDMEIDMLGDAYEFLIGRFAATAGKSRRVLYTTTSI